MIYDFNNTIEVERCRKRFTSLLARKALVEVREARKSEDNNQKRKYFHTILRFCARELGWTNFEYFKAWAIVKCGYYQEIDGVQIRDRTSEMNAKVYSRLIDDFINFIEQEHGVIVPRIDEEWEKL